MGGMGLEWDRTCGWDWIGIGQVMCGGTGLEWDRSHVLMVGCYDLLMCTHLSTT